MTRLDASTRSTTYTYDSAFRLTDVAPAGAATSSYAYTSATSSANARVVETVSNGSTEITKSTYEFDGLGRIKRKSTTLPDGKLAAVQTDYDGYGRKSRVSQPIEATTHPTSDSGTDWTSFVYDPFGRQLSVQTPDAKTLTFAYTGVRKVARTASIATSIAGSENVTTFESYDALGRLSSVDEASAGTSATKTSGETVSTAYTYDVGGRVASVAMSDGTTTQDRGFAYDGRGFLSSETHPEQTSDTTYSDYDARGHAGKRVNGGRTVQLTYDAAERLTDVAEIVGGTQKALKKFVFSPANDGADLQKGKLLSAVRYNETTAARKTEVKETYTYSTPAGQMSKVTTRIDHVADDGTRTKVQELSYQTEYDELLLPKTLTMPTCDGCATTNGLASVTYGRTAGFLTSVSNLPH